MGTYQSDQRTSRFFGLKLNRNNDGAMIEHLEQQGNIQEYLKNLISNDMRGGKTMKEISLDNGRTYLNAHDAIEELRKQSEEYEVPFAKLWQNIADLMDDDTRETVHAELAPCTEEEFLARYLEIAPDDLITG